MEKQPTHLRPATRGPYDACSPGHCGQSSRGGFPPREKGPRSRRGGRGPRGGRKAGAEGPRPPRRAAGRAEPRPRARPRKPHATGPRERIRSGPGAAKRQGGA